MADRINRGQIWLYTFRSPDKGRPVLVLSRPDVIELLHTVIVAPVTTTVHGVPSEVIVGIDEGLKQDSAINLDHIQTIDKAKLKHFVGIVGAEKMRAVCSALAIATGCDTQATAN
jgi:mRNA interferase MazF